MQSRRIRVDEASSCTPLDGAGDATSAHRLGARPESRGRADDARSSPSSRPRPPFRTSPSPPQPGRRADHVGHHRYLAALRPQAQARAGQGRGQAHGRLPEQRRVPTLLRLELKAPAPTEADACPSPVAPLASSATLRAVASPAAWALVQARAVARQPTRLPLRPRQRPPCDPGRRPALGGGRGQSTC